MALINGIECKKFKPSDFACQCGCGLSNPAHMLLEKLNIARVEADVPFYISSGSRCLEHDSEVYKEHYPKKLYKATSSHLPASNGFTYAIDIKASTSRQRHAVLAGLRFAGFNRIGIAKTFIHADVDLYKDDNVTWLY